MTTFSTETSPTLAEVKAAVSARGYDASETELEATINSAYREALAGRRWPFMDTRSASLSIPADAESVSIGGIADLLHIDAVRLENGTASYTLDWQHIQTLKTCLNEYRTSGEPENWSRQGGELYVYPRPDATYVLAIDYVAQPPALADDADLLVLPRIHMDCVTWGAVAQFAFRSRDWGASQTAEQKRNDAVARMVRAYAIEQRQGGRTVVETGFWDDMA